MIGRFIKYLLVFFVYLAGAQPQAPNIITSSNFICTDIPITFSAQTTNSTTTYSWSITPSKSVTLSSSNTESFVTYNINNSGSYTLNLVISDPTGTASTSNVITVNKTAYAAFNASLNTTGYPNQLVLTNFSTFSSFYLWAFSDDNSVNTNSLNAVKNYSISGSYTVTLIAYNTSGCNDTSDYSFRISDTSGITVPTIFSPNGDNINEIFKPITKGITSINVWIYNRYGAIITSWDRINSFWDGHTTSGETCEPGVYFVIIEAKGFDGKSHKLKNNLTLVR
jgi:gliding motility-associated-like protein